MQREPDGNRDPGDYEIGCGTRLGGRSVHGGRLSRMMDMQSVIIGAAKARGAAPKTVRIPADDVLVAAALELRSAGKGNAPAGGQYGPCLGLYVPPSGYKTVEVDPFTGAQGKPIKGGTIREVCVFRLGETTVADTFYEHEPPRIHYYCTRAGAPEPVSPEHTPVTTIEGGRDRVERSEYERSPLLREACLRAHGFRCVVCDISLEECYGEAARELIHVHHLEPLAVAGGAHPVDPTTDLIPVCPNCHAVMHRRQPPYTPDEMRTMLRPHTRRVATLGPLPQLVGRSQPDPVA
ncbi:MAG: hypothetical protein HKN37_14090 [Rhodothermales bacterium]|nr:hypothetical protein [Rhodothermales bacterium]